MGNCFEGKDKAMPMKNFSIVPSAARSYNVWPSDNTEGVIMSTTLSKPYVAQLPNVMKVVGSCSCNYDDLFLIPYRHACAFALRVKVLPITLINRVYYAQMYHETYIVLHKPVPTEALTPDSPLPFRLKRPRGRPAAKKKWNGGQTSQAATEDARGHWRSCGSAEHNRRTCHEAQT